MSGPAKGRPRRDAILDLVVPAEITVDVGCDHGHVAAALARQGRFVIGVERRSQRLPERSDVPLVVCDGLSALRRVDLAIITGMGGRIILDILARGPQPKITIIHSPNHTDELRQGLADAGWRIDAERLAPESRGYAEVIRVVRGEEPAQGHALWFGPKLLDQPLARAHAEHQLAHWRRITKAAPPESEGYARAAGWVGFLEPLLERLP